MDEEPKIQALVACQVQACAEEHSYPLDMVQMFKGKPICQQCYEEDERVETDEDGVQVVDWHDLPSITIADLRE